MLYPYNLSFKAQFPKTTEDLAKSQTKNYTELHKVERKLNEIDEIGQKYTMLHPYKEGDSFRVYATNVLFSGTNHMLNSKSVPLNLPKDAEEKDIVMAITPKIVAKCEKEMFKEFIADKDNVETREYLQSLLNKVPATTHIAFLNGYEEAKGGF